jgi:hypothetical protein
MAYVVRELVKKSVRQLTLLLSLELKSARLDGKTVAHTCNPSYSGCRDQEDSGSKPA